MIHHDTVYDWLVARKISCFHIVGMSSSQLRSIIFQKGRLNHQPDEIMIDQCHKPSSESIQTHMIDRNDHQSKHT